MSEIVPPLVTVTGHLLVALLAGLGIAGLGLSVADPPPDNPLPYWYIRLAFLVAGLICFCAAAWIWARL